MSFINKIASGNFAQGISSNLGKVCTKIGESLDSAVQKAPDKDTFISRALRTIEPTGSNNPFISLAALMVGTVIVPRVLTAAKRNPDNKEATKDEITEILFRDCQTVLIMLFALKSANSLIASLATKLKGIPMTNKPYEKLFDTTESGFKGIIEKGKEFISSPLQKLKTIGKNVLSTIHPTGGVYALNNDEFISKYSGFSSIKDIRKLIDEIDSQGGDHKKVFNKIIDSIINEQKILLEGNGKSGADKIEGLYAQATRMANPDGKFTQEFNEKITNAERIKGAFEEIKEKGYEAFTEANLNEDTKQVLFNFFKNKDNTLVREAKGLTAILKSIALAVEVVYLGFGLPALNQLRLEKKYLKKNPNAKEQKKQEININSASNSSIKKSLTPQQVKIFSGFIK